ncbi:MAG: polysaccharide pyruvyl transferase family protein [Lachnospiraceae bacterium]|nr:polysaccharide pyruvyl transferase family protein [Lachnospiraceae bacterium]
MKYGILTYGKRPMRIGGTNRLNIGDPIQTYAMQYIYSRMGIKKEELVEISRYTAKDYNGDYVLLPYNCFNRIYNQLGHAYGSLPLSAKILPVFLSFHLHSRHIEESILQNLKAFQPVGCRDEETMINMRNHGILSYHSGCVTALLPKRKEAPRKGKVFFVDIPDSLMPYIPEELKENAVFTGHHVVFERDKEEEYLTDTEYERFYQMGVKQLEQYRDEAALVVTSRLHAATPCMAMGIPVIAVSDSFDGRFSGLDKYIPLYAKEDFESIDWNPVPVEYEVQKEQMIHCFIKQIERAYEQYAGIYDISTYYEKRKRHMYNKGLIQAVHNLPISGDKKVRYGVWGLTTLAQTLKNVIEDCYHDWKFEVAIDKTSDGLFEGVEVLKPSDIEALDEEIIYFIIPASAHQPAKELLGTLGRRFVLVNGTRMEWFG